MADSNPSNPSLPAPCADPGIKPGSAHLKLSGVRRPRPVSLDTGVLSDLLCKHGGSFLPVADLLASGQTDFDQLIQDAGVCMIEATLKASVEQMIGPKRPGFHRDSGLVRFGSQPGLVHFSDRSVRVTRPRMRRRLDDGTTREETIPAYEALRHHAVARRVGQIVINGVSTRKYRQTIVNTAQAVGISASAVSRELIEDAQAAFKELVERPLGGLDILAVLIDGVIIATHHVLVAIGVSSTGSKHVLGLRLGASENAVVATALLEDLGARGLKPGVTRLFVLDGSKALRAAVHAVYGDVPVQRCRLHKIRNVCDQLPDDQSAQTRSIMKAAFGMKHKAGISKLREHIAWLDREHPSAARSLEEGLEEMFTVNRLELPPRLCRSFSSTNMIESPNSGVRRAIGRVTRWRDGSMVLRWVGHALNNIELRWRRIDGADLLWVLRQNLDALALNSKGNPAVKAA
jgi:putative transposase